MTLDTWYLQATFPKSTHSFQSKLAPLPNYFMTYDIKSSIATKSLCDTTKYACEGD